MQKDAIKVFFGINDTGYQHYKDMHEKGMETHRHSLFYFLVVDRETNCPIGECGFHTWNRTHRRAELFYLLRNDTHKQKGYMTEVVPYVIRYGFEHMDLVRIEALLANWNTPSVRLLQQNRFTFEGTMRQHYSVNGIHEDSDCYSLLKTEWETHFFSSSNESD
jgi:ribosomal-protein-alanine N-acetyltransferase